MALRARTPVVEDDTKPPIDEGQEQGQSLRSGQVEDGQAFIESVAKRAGWTPKEEWTRDPVKWTDAATYLENTPKEVKTLKERLSRTAQAAADAIEDQRRQARIDAQAEVRKAAEDKDPEAAVAAADKLAQASGPDPQTVAWIGKNSWFEDDEDARTMAIRETNRLAATGASIREQLEGAEAKVRKRFPEHFEEAPKPKEEVTLRESRVAPPPVASGSRGGGAPSKEKGFADIPAGDRALYQKHFAPRFERTMKKEDAQAKYAASYWKNKGDE